MTQNSKHTAFIFARGGSKGVPQKNIYPVAGRPLIAHSIRSALASNSVGRVVVSTDNPEIAKAAKKSGAEVLDRPEELATDSAPEVLAWRHALDCFPELFSGSDPAPFISLPATSPLRAPEDIDAAVARFKSGEFDVIFGITPSHRNPYLNMVVQDQQGMIKLALGGSAGVRRQDVPEMFDITTCVYVARPGHIRNCVKLIDGRAGYVLIPVERSLDIDTYFDLHVAELLLSSPFMGKA